MHIWLGKENFNLASKILRDSLPDPGGDRRGVGLKQGVVNYKIRYFTTPWSEDSEVKVWIQPATCTTRLFVLALYEYARNRRFRTRDREVYDVRTPTGISQFGFQRMRKSRVLRVV